MTDDKLRERMLKILRLARQGVGGEAANAEVLLQKLMKQHDVTLDMLESNSEAKTTVWFRCRNNDEKAILSGLGHKLFGADLATWRQQGSGKAGYWGVDLTPKQHAELLIHWEVYLAAWEQTVSDIKIAFMSKHQLFAPSKKGRRYFDELTPEEQEAWRRRKALANSLDNVAAPFKRIAQS